MERHEEGREGDPVVLRWKRHPRSVGLAREALLKTLAGWELAALEDSAVLVVSELVTNAVRHADVPPGREIETRFHMVPRGLRIEVHDACSEQPERRPVSEEACEGRGLTIVEALTDTWGVADRPGVGKAVWALLCLPVLAASLDGDAESVCGAGDRR
ncbi:ATP-binding protein [Streptomyces sp. NPDC012623]|uniref:ATP-binding protein n=1 Tax=unclassified Streptomyces TaxID=2593676 RepID=UPI0036CAA486